MLNIKQKLLSLTTAIVLGLALLLGVALAGSCLSGTAAAVDTDPTASTNEVDISDSSVLHWAVVGSSMTGSNSNLLDGRVYAYRYRESGASTYSYYYSIIRKTTPPDSTWTNWEQYNAFDVKYSIMRFRSSGVEHQIEIQSNDLNTKFEVVEYVEDSTYTRKATEQGVYRAQVKLATLGDYVFTNDSLLRATLEERGITLNISPDGKTATMTKIWYVANFDNALLDGSESIATQSEVEYTIPSWKFGEYETVDYPWLYHGDGALRADLDLQSDYSVSVKIGGEYVKITEDINMAGRARSVDLKPAWDPRSADQTNDIVTFSLIRVEEDGNRISITEKTIRSRWNYYINEYMPAGTYELTIHVEDIMLTSHKHWWDGTAHTIVDATEAEFKGFDCTYNFTVALGDLQITNESSLADNDLYRYVDINDLGNDLSSDYSKFFEFSKDFVYDYKIKTSELKNNTYWTANETVISRYYDSVPHLEYNLFRMKDDTYYLASDSVWREFINEPSTYTVYYMAKMKNYSTYPLISDRYDSYYEVLVYKDILLPELNRTEMVYTGGELSVAPKEGNSSISLLSDISLYSWTGHTGTNAGNYTVTFTLNDSEHYKWYGVKKNGQKYDFGDEYQIDWTIKQASVRLPQIDERNYAPNKTFTPAITIPTDVNGKDVFTFPPSQFYEAGTYDIVLTLSSDNYVWNFTEEDADKDSELDPLNPLKATVKFIIAPEQNMWIVSPRVATWSWGGYDKTKNLIEGAAMRGETRFAISYDSNGNSIVDGLGNITLVDGFVDDVIAKKLGALNQGEYYLIATVKADNNYTGLTSNAYKFAVAEATNYWDSAPNIIRWKYDGYDASINLITGTPHFGETVKFSIVTNRANTVGDDFVVSGLENITVIDGVVQGEAREILAKLGCNQTYWLRAIVEQKPVLDDGKPVYNYSGLTAYIEFHILQSNNYWIETPNIQRWVEGEATAVPTGQSMWGEPVFVIYRYETSSNGDKVKGEKMFDSREGLNKLDEARPGRYLLESTVEGNYDYTSLFSSLEFKVFSTSVNFWRTVPNIQSWVAGDVPNAPVASAAFGTVYYIYYDKADYLENGENAQKLGGVPVSVGDYVLVAIAVSSELDDLTAVVEFSIYNPPNNTVYYAIIGVLAGVLLLVIELIIMIAVIKNRRRLKLVAADGGGVEVDATDDEELGEEFDEESEQDSDDDGTGEDFFDAEIIAEPVDEDAPALEPTSID